MAHPAIPRLIPTAAREAHTALVAALGTAHIPDQWMIFMEAVTTHLPKILSGDGRPTAADIRHSVIGISGFKSWRQMIEAPTDQGGLGWNYSTWKAYRRAWGYIGKYPWLRNERQIYSEVIRLGLLLDKAKQTPENMEEALAIVAEIKAEAASKDARESNSDSDSSRSEYDRMVRGRTARRIRDLRNKQRDLARQYRVLDDRAHQLGQDLATANQSLAKLEETNTDAQQRLNWHRKRTVWQHMRQALKHWFRQRLGR